MSGGRLPRVLCVGEVLVDLIRDGVGKGSRGMTFHGAAGGSVANVAVGLARLGIASRFIGKVGDDAFGHFLRRELDAHGVDTSRLLATDQAKTTLAIVNLDQSAIPTFDFYAGADMLLTPDEVKSSWCAAATLLHSSSLLLRASPSREAVYAGLALATRHGLVISFDPNLRLSLWPDPKAARREILQVARYAAVLKLNQAELRFLTGMDDLQLGIDSLLSCLGDRLHRAVPNRLVVVTRGAEGCAYVMTDQSGTVASGQLIGEVVETVDTTGAGDAFTAGLLASLYEHGGIDQGRLVALAPDALREICRYANVTAALSTTAHGAIPAMPDRLAVARALARAVGRPGTSDGEIEGPAAAMGARHNE